MLIAIFTDIHSNREALNACLADAAQQGAEQYVFLGDLVGYGPDPVAVVERVAEFAQAGAIVVQGNHDAAAVGVPMPLSSTARTAIEWTKRQLDEHHSRFLHKLPLSCDDDDRLYVHASADEPEAWNYIFDARDAVQSFRAAAQRFTFCGHTHLPVMFSAASPGIAKKTIPVDNCPVRLTMGHRWICVLGAVGQPRDRNPAACYGLFETDTSELIYQRVAYDVAATARKIVAAGLPDLLAKRLLAGS